MPIICRYYKGNLFPGLGLNTTMMGPVPRHTPIQLKMSDVLRVRNYLMLQAHILYIITLLGRGRGQSAIL